MKMQCEIDVPDQNLLDTLTTAVEQGIAYWANEEAKNVQVLRDKDGYVKQVNFTIEGEEKSIVPRSLLEAYAKLLTNQVQAGAIAQRLLTLVDKDAVLDAVEADALFQLAAFGEVWFG